jgi:uncharacterized protein (DUF362 family)
MVRTSLFGLGLDAANFGNKQWNPLGDYVNSRATILLKPNWVNNINPVGGLDCTVTHPSIIRCVIDYCIIAKAKVIEVGDAPIQDCDFNDLMEKHGYKRLFEYMYKMGINIKISDFRLTVSKRVSKISNKVILQQNNPDMDLSKVIEFDLKDISYFNSIETNSIYRSINYHHEKLNERHNKEHHKYLLYKSLFDADLIINLPKPKTHRYAGITGAQKNFIGACSEKDYLPHCRVGAPKTGGDELRKSTVAGNLFSLIDRKRCRSIERRGIKSQLFFGGIQYCIYNFNKLINKGFFVNGIWHGNDTIWRTILDINLILLYGDSNGGFNPDAKPRNILTIGDMIVAGESGGPLKPSPKYLGIILASDNCALFDYVFCRITGFDYKLIPTVKNSLLNKSFIQDLIDDMYLHSNMNDLCISPLSALDFPDEWKFIPAPTWVDVL